MAARQAYRTMLESARQEPLGELGPCTPASPPSQGPSCPAEDSPLAPTGKEEPHYSECWGQWGWGPSSSRSSLTLIEQGAQESGMATVAKRAAEGPVKPRPLFKRWSQMWEGRAGQWVSQTDLPWVTWHPEGSREDSCILGGWLSRLACTDLFDPVHRGGCIWGFLLESFPGPTQGARLLGRQCAACFPRDFPDCGGSDAKQSACNTGDLGLILGWEDSQPRKKWQSTPIFLPGESHGQRSLVGYSPWD